MRRLTALLWLLPLLGGCANADPRPAADWLFTGGAVYTVDPGQPWAEAVAVRGGRIVFVGGADRAAAWRGESTRVVDLTGRMLLPGFHDSHMHPMAAGTRFLRCQLGGLAWPDAVLARIEVCSANLRDGEWLRAIDLPDAALEDPDTNWRLLDHHTNGNAAVVVAESNASVWVNSAALAAAGIAADTPDPKGGRIVRDPETGEPTGVLHGEAYGAVWSHASHYREDELREALRRASAMANRFGITSAGEASTSADHWSAYRAAEAAGEMTLRVAASLRWNPSAGAEQLDALARLRDAADGPRFRASSAKLFVDGGAWGTAALLEPYVGGNGDHGTLTYGERLSGLVELLDRAGFDVHLHAFGDRAVRDGLDAVAAAVQANPPRDRRHHLSHLALVDASDLQRFPALDVTADVQPLWAHRDAIEDGHAALLGPRRLDRMVPVRSLFAAGARVVAGSDWISESMNPLVAIQYAVTRRPLDGSGPAWNTEERATLAQMLEAYTINGAWLARQETETGSIEVGKAADLVVLDRNLFDVDPQALHEVRVLLTLLEGEAVYSDSTSLASARISAGMTFTRATRASQRGSSRSFSK